MCERSQHLLWSISRWYWSDLLVHRGVGMVSTNSCSDVPQGSHWGFLLVLLVERAMKTQPALLLWDGQVKESEIWGHYTKITENTLNPWWCCPGRLGKKMIQIFRLAHLWPTKSEQLYRCRSQSTCLLYGYWSVNHLQLPVSSGSW